MSFRATPPAPRRSPIQEVSGLALSDPALPAQREMHTHVTGVHGQPSADLRDTPTPLSPLAEKPAGGGYSWPSAAINFTNAIVGSGICGLPFAMSECGALQGFLMVLAAGWFTDRSCKLLVGLGDQHGIRDYEELCRAVLGQWGFVAATLAMATFAFGAMVSYQIIIGDTVGPVLHAVTGWHIFENRNAVIAASITAVGFPLGAQRDVGILASASALSVTASSCLVGLVALRARSTAAGQWQREAVTVLAATADDSIAWVALQAPDGRCAFNVSAPSNASTPVALAVQLPPLVPRQLHYAAAFGGDVPPPQAAADCGAAVRAARARSSAPRSGAVLLHGRERQRPGRRMLRRGAPRLVLTWGDSGARLSARWRRGRSAVGHAALRSQQDAQWFAGTSGGFVRAFGTVAFCFVCQHAAFLIRASLRDPADWARVSVVGSSAATLLGAVIAVIGYSAFGKCVRPDIVNNFEEGDFVADVARLLLACAMFLTYPMEFFVVRHCVQALLVLRLGRDAGRGLHWPITVGVFLTALPLALVLEADDLAPVLSLTGGVSAATLAFLLPGLLHYASCTRMDLKLLPAALADVHHLPELALCIIGAWSLVLTLLNVGSAAHEVPVGCPSVS